MLPITTVYIDYSKKIMDVCYDCILYLLDPLKLWYQVATAPSDWHTYSAALCMDYTTSAKQFLQR